MDADATRRRVDAVLAALDGIPPYTSRADTARAIVRSLDADGWHLVDPATPHPDRVVHQNGVTILMFDGSTVDIADETPAR